MPRKCFCITRHSVPAAIRVLFAKYSRCIPKSTFASLETLLLLENSFQACRRLDTPRVSDNFANRSTFFMQSGIQSRSKDLESRSLRNLSSVDVGFQARPHIGSINFLSIATPRLKRSALETCCGSFIFFRTFRPSHEWCPPALRLVFPVKNCSNRLVDTSVVTRDERSSRGRSYSIKSWQVNRESSAQSFHAMHSDDISITQQQTTFHRFGISNR